MGELNRSHTTTRPVPAACPLGQPWWSFVHSSRSVPRWQTSLSRERRGGCETTGAAGYSTLKLYVGGYWLVMQASKGGGDEGRV